MSRPLNGMGGHGEAARLRQLGWEAFARSDFADAADRFEQLAALAVLAEAELGALVETSIAVGRGREAAQAIVTWLDGATEIDARDRLRWTEEGFALARTHGLAAEAESCGLALLESAAALADTHVWLELVGSGHLRDIESAMTAPLSLLEALEQESFAPEATGLPAIATRRIEEIGRQHAAEYAVARMAERLLHAAGNRAAAYRVERSRRASALAVSEPGKLEPTPEMRLGGRRVVIAGGHPHLRARLRADLLAAGAGEVREVPSAKEASRLTRDVQAVMAGADAAVVIVRQIAHSTIDQVKTAGGRLGVPVIPAQSASTHGVRRALERWLSA